MVRMLTILGFSAAIFSARDAAGQWIILHGKNGHTEQRVPAETVRKIKEVAKQGVPIHSVAFTPEGGRVMLYDKGEIGRAHV